MPVLRLPRCPALPVCSLEVVDGPMSNPPCRRPESIPTPPQLMCSQAPNGPSHPPERRYCPLATLPSPWLGGEDGRPSQHRRANPLSKPTKLLAAPRLALQTCLFQIDLCFKAIDWTLTPLSHFSLLGHPKASHQAGVFPGAFSRPRSQLRRRRSRRRDELPSRSLGT